MKQTEENDHLLSPFPIPICFISQTNIQTLFAWLLDAYQFFFLYFVILYEVFVFLLMIS